MSIGAIRPIPMATLMIQARSSHRRRAVINSITLVLTSLATFVALIPLVWVIGDVIMRGLPFLTMAFLTETFKPVSQGGGGVIQAIVGSAELVGIASCISIPISMLAAIYVAGHRDHPIQYRRHVRVAFDCRRAVRLYIYGERSRLFCTIG